MNWKKLTLLVGVLLIADQVLKIWIKTHLALGEAIIVCPDWFQLRFIENPGVAFGMRIASNGAFDWGKLLLGIFRLVFSGLIAWYVLRLARNKQTPKGVLIVGAMIFAGAVGNILDSA
ncbi:MAG: signal peptidase II, partial [Alistipes sp.]|nr:signal peptidase II [Alistipes sp.]